jgi:hypothetical protein
LNPDPLAAMSAFPQLGQTFADEGVPETSLLDCCLNDCSIVSKLLPLVSGIAIKQTIIVSRDVKPKKKYASKEDFAGRIGVVNAIIQLATFLLSGYEVFR